jgi:glycosyltransferase involved in cell wall biosynthesis
VVIIFLNAERFIRDAVESVFAQTYPHCELFLVDDGSTDGSSDIARAYAARLPSRVQYLEHPHHANHGMSASRNLGIASARGEFVAFVDADDVWLPHKLERQVEIMHRQPEAALVYGLTHYWFSWTGKPEDLGRDFIPDLGVVPNTLVRPPRLLSLLLQSKAPSPCPSDFLVRRELLQRVGGFEETFQGIYQLFEDQAFLSKIYLNEPVFVAGESWFRYRQHPKSWDSLMAAADKKYTAGLFFLAWLERYLDRHGVTNIEILRALRRKRWRYRHPSWHRLLMRVRHYARAG